ncbi:MAG: amidohydrolase family protein [Actinobacteria bacterium]|nr:amidohydrolase family protein [Actinomycetota bacterium]
MKVITIEEHFATPELIEAWAALPPEYADPAVPLYRHGPPSAALVDLGAARLAWMDQMGIDVQVISLTSPGVQSLEPAAAVELARRSNDLLARTVAEHPDRFQGLAALPTPDPVAAAAELRRAVGELGLQGAIVFGRTRERSLDHPAGEPILATAEELSVPLFLHPQISRPQVRAALYSDLPPGFDFALAGPGLGWHLEAGVQFVRLALTGALDRHPGLRIILGHWGDAILFYLDELDVIPRVAQSDCAPVSEYAKRHLYVAASGTLSHRYTRWATEILGPDRLLFALDHPFVPRAPGDVASFLAGTPLSATDREGFASGNWEELVGGVRGV